MAAIEWRVLSGILREGGLDSAVQSGLRDEFFKDSEAKRIYRFLRDYWFGRSTYHTLPTFNVVKRRFPSFTLTGQGDGDVEDTLPALVHELKMASHDTDIRALAAYFQELVEEDPKEAIETFHSHTNAIINRYHHAQKMGLSEVRERAKEHYEGAQNGVVYGIPWPWEPLTRDTLGKRAGDFIVLYGRMKSMKTWVGLFNAIYDYKVNNCRVLVWSREMNKEKMSLRAASLLSEVDYQLFKSGRLPKHLEKRMFQSLDELAETEKEEGDHRRDLLFLAGRDAPKTLQELSAEIEHFKPDVVYLDSWYHLTSDADSPKGQRRSERIATLAEGVKGLAEDHGIPIIAIHQANREGEASHGNTMTDMSDSDVIAREADLIIRVFKRRGKELYEDDYEVAMNEEKKKAAEEEYAAAAKEVSDPSQPKKKMRLKLGGNKNKNKPKLSKKEQVAKEATEKALDNPDEERVRVSAELALVMPGNREGTLEAFTIRAIPGYDFGLISSDYTISEIEAWIKGDSGEAKKKAPSQDYKKAFNMQAGASTNTKPGPKLETNRQ